MLTSYVNETDEEMRPKNNRTFNRIVAGLPDDVAERYGDDKRKSDRLQMRLAAAEASQNWHLVATTAATLAKPNEAAS